MKRMISRRTRHAVLSVLGACILVYFLYHTVQGDRGWLAMLRLKNEVSTQQDKLHELQGEHKELEHRVQIMRPSSMDPDLLDEEARKKLDYSKPGEIIILTPQDKPPEKPQ
jgi:cell division protein FtsB